MITHISEKETQLTDMLRKTGQALDACTAERDALELSIDQWRVDYHELRIESEALVQERDALKADALRWRYMRSKGANWFGVQEMAHDIDFDGGLDEAVDAAMKGKL